MAQQLSSPHKAPNTQYCSCSRHMKVAPSTFLQESMDSSDLHRSQCVTPDLSRDNRQRRKGRGQTAAGREDRWTNRADTCFHSSATCTPRQSKSNRSASRTHTHTHTHTHTYTHTFGSVSHTESTHSESERKQRASSLDCINSQSSPKTHTHTHTRTHTHTHRLAGRAGHWALGWQKHYRLPHKPLPVFTTSDICCLRLHVWIQHFH